MQPLRSIDCRRHRQGGNTDQCSINPSAHDVTAVFSMLPLQMAKPTKPLPPDAVPNSSVHLVRLTQDPTVALNNKIFIDIFFLTAGIQWQCFNGCTVKRPPVPADKRREPATVRVQRQRDFRGKPNAWIVPERIKTRKIITVLHKGWKYLTGIETHVKHCGEFHLWKYRTYRLCHHYRTHSGDRMCRPDKTGNQWNTE